MAAEVKSGLEAESSPGGVQREGHHWPRCRQGILLPLPVRAKPVAAVFTREITFEVANLVQEIDTAVGRE